MIEISGLLSVFIVAVIFVMRERRIERMRLDYAKSVCELGHKLIVANELLGARDSEIEDAASALLASVGRSEADTSLWTAVTDVLVEMEELRRRLSIAHSPVIKIGDLEE